MLILLKADPRCRNYLAAQHKGWMDMIKLNRTTEYGLIALRHMFLKRLRNDFSVTSAREISDTYSLPFEITAKTLQRLKDTALIQSEQGAKGGYSLAKPMSDVKLGEFLEMMEGPQSVVGCTFPHQVAPCEFHDRCEIKGVMHDLNERVRGFLWSIHLTDLTEFGAQPFSPVGLSLKNKTDELKLGATQ